MLAIDLATSKALAAAMRDENLCLFLPTDIQAASDGVHGTALSVDPLDGAMEDDWLALRKWKIEPRLNEGTPLTDAQRTLFDFLNNNPCICASEDTPTPEWAMLEPLTVDDIKAAGSTHCVFPTPEDYASDAEAMQPGSTANPDPADAT